MSPEQTLNEDATPLSDLFSMGIIGAEMLLGENVFRGENLSKTFKRIQKLRIKAEAFPKGTPKALIKVILKLLAKNPSKRYLSAADAADDLSKIMKGYPRHMEPYLAEWVLATLNGKESLVEPQIVPDRSKKFFIAGAILGAVVVATLWILVHFL
jgi:serine/threonine-protein kinase